MLRWLAISFKDIGSSFLKLLAFLKVVLIGAEMETVLNNAIKNIGPCARFLPGSFKDMKFDEIERSSRFRGNFGF